MDQPGAGAALVGGAEGGARYSSGAWEMRGDTSWGSSENISEVRKYFNKKGRKYFAPCQCLL